MLFTPGFPKKPNQGLTPIKSEEQQDTEKQKVQKWGEKNRAGEFNIISFRFGYFL